MFSMTYKHSDVIQVSTSQKLKKKKVIEKESLKKKKSSMTEKHSRAI